MKKPLNGLVPIPLYQEPAATPAFADEKREDRTSPCNHTLPAQAAATTCSDRAFRWPSGPNSIRHM